jgi:hypothetical protein
MMKYGSLVGQEAETLSDKLCEKLDEEKLQDSYPSLYR